MVFNKNLFQKIFMVVHIWGIYSTFIYNRYDKVE